MANYNSLVATINSNIKQNDNQEITGVILNSVLKEMVDALKAGYIFKGIATASTNPGSPDERVFYLAAAGTYQYFSATVPQGHIGVFYFDTAWHTTSIDIAPVIQVIDNLHSSSATAALSARMGAILGDRTSLEVPLNGIWRQGSIANNGAYLYEYNNRIVVAHAFEGDISFDVASGYYVAVHSYSEKFYDIAEASASSGYLGSITGEWRNGHLELSQLTGGKTYVIIVKKGSAGTDTISPSIGNDVVLNLIGQDSIKPIVEDLRELIYGYAGGTQTDSLSVVQGGIESDGSLINSGTYYNKRVRTDAFRVYGEFSLSISASGSPVSYNIYFYETADTTTCTGNLGIWATQATFNGNYNGYIRVLFKYSTGDSDIAPSAVSASVTQVVHIAGLLEEMNGLLEDTGNYVWGSDLVRRKVIVSQIGQLTHPQAFCVYGGKYYSTDGSHIAEQDSSFALLRNVSVNLGHGNSLQLVGGGKAWASGWDDDTMYKVDLATLTVEETLTLPVSGYTTVAVNEDAGLMYIFQRTSYPSTVAQYNFITYDYVNEQILSTRKIESFAAMQSADYYEGKILMLYGLGTSAIPGGMRIYNTAGDVLATFDLAFFASTEPEGIMFEREGKRLMVSDYGRNLYEITSQF